MAVTPLPSWVHQWKAFFRTLGNWNLGQDTSWRCNRPMVLDICSMWMWKGKVILQGSQDCRRKCSLCGNRVLVDTCPVESELGTYIPLGGLELETHRLESSRGSVQFSSVAQSCPTLCNPMDCSMPGFPVHHQLPELMQTYVHWVLDAIHPSHALLYPSPPTFNLTQHQGIFQRVGSSHQVTKVMEFQLQHQSFQWIFRTDFL